MRPAVPGRRYFIPHLGRWAPAAAGVVCLLLAGLIMLASRELTRGVVYGTRSLEPTSYVDVNPFGVNVFLDRVVEEQQLRRTIEMVHSAGFGWIRQLFSWAEIEPEAKGEFWDSKTGQSSWTKWDRIVDAAREQDLQVIARIERPPNWTRSDNTYPERPPDNLEDYGDFVYQFVRHFKGRVRYYQIWNEPNRYEDWGHQPINVGGYVAMLKLAYRRAKEADPEALILSAALTPTIERTSKNLDDLVFLQRMYEQGARQYFDVMAIQAYGLRGGPEDPLSALGRLDPREAWRVLATGGNTNFARAALIREVMARNGDAGKAIWATEFGWNALPAGWAGEPSPWGSVSRETQARYTVEGYRRAWNEWPWIGVMNVWFFQWVGSPDPRDPTPYFALVGPDFQPTPAYLALTQLAQQPRPARVGYHRATASPVAYSGPWGPAPGGASTGHASPVSGARVSLHFHGNEVAIRVLRGPAAGILRATVDGSATLATALTTDVRGLASVDLYSPGEQSGAYIRIAEGLPDDDHVLELTVSGLKNPSSSDAGCQIDAFIVGRTRSPLPPFLAGLLAVLGLSLLSVQAAREAARRRVLRRVSPLLTGVPRLAIVACALALPFHTLPLKLGPLVLPSSELLLLLGAGAAFTLWLLRGAPFGRFPGLGLVLFTTAAATLSLLVSAYPRYSLREYRLEVLEPLALYVIVVTLFDRRWARRCLYAALLGGALVALIGLAGYALGVRVVDAYGVRRMLSLYPSPDHLALYMERLAPLGLALALASQGRRRLGFSAAALLAASAVLLSFSRGGWLGLVAGVAVVLVVALPSWRLWWVAAGAGGSLLLVALGRSYPLLDLLGGTSVSRLRLWQAAWRMLEDGHLLSGVGMDNFLYFYQYYRLPASAAEPTLSHPHNVILDFWLSLGILGLPLLGWMVVRAARFATLTWSRDSDRLVRALALGVGGSLVAGLAHGLVDNSYFLIDLAAWLWLSLGVLQVFDSSREEASARMRSLLPPIPARGQRA